MKKDIEKLQGTWNIVALEMEGQKMATAGSKIVIKGNRFTTLAMGAKYAGSIAVNETASPKTFDLKFTSGPEKGNTSLGIYELDEDAWKICISVTSKTRPQKFATAPGSGHALETLQREKPGTQKKEAAADITQGAPGTRATGSAPPELEGEWSMESCVLDGHPLDAATVKYGKRVARGNEMTVFMGGNPLLKAKFSVDRTKKPMAMDYVLEIGPNAGKTQLGIYELDGKTLKTSFALPGQGRPTDFRTADGDGRTVTVWKLEKK
jgi:uncharacterized protein (TIGR03067 family)